MKRLALSLLLVAIAPLTAKAFVPVNDQTDLLSYVAMPLAVSQVCDVRGVQTARVGDLVTYMDQANVAPADFVDVFRYVPVALVMRTDRHPDFVEWVHGQVGQGIVGPALVTAMEQQLGTYSNSISVVSNRYTTRTRRHRRYTYDDYPYREVFADDYVPVVVRRYCEREVVEPLALIDMPVAVANVYELGVPVQRVSSLAVELNLGGVPPLQFVELFRYAPAALVVDTAYAPDFVSYVHTQEVAGVYGLPLVQSIDRQLPVYGVNAQLDLTSPGYYYSPDNYYAPRYAPTAPQFQAQYYVPPVDPAYVPPLVQSRIASGYAAGGARYALPPQTAPAIAAAPQVQRLLNAPNGGAVVTSPNQARRELAREARMARQAPPIAAPAPAFAASNASPVMAARPVMQHGNGNGNGHGRGRAVAAAPPVFAQPAPAPQFHGNGNGRGNEHGNGNGNGHGHGHTVAAAPPVFAQPAPAPQFHGNGNGRGNGNGNGHGHGRAVAAAPPVFAQPAPAPQFHGNGNEHGNGNGNGHGRRAVMQQAAPAPAPVPQPVMAAPQAVPHGNGHGHGGGPPMQVAPAPAPAVAAPPQGGNGHVPPGQEKKGKGH
jgi:hypothetical protein